MSDVTVVISNTGPQGAAGQGVPAGGTLGQLLRKASATNYDTEWADAGAGLGTVTSVGLSLPGIFTVSGSPVTAAGTLTAVLATQAAARVFAGPSAGADAAPTFRALVGTDVPLATTSAQGALSAADKTKLDSITVDSATLVRKFVRNNSGVSIPKGAAVYQTGSSGTTLTDRKSVV